MSFTRTLPVVQIQTTPLTLPSPPRGEGTTLIRRSHFLSPPGERTKVRGRGDESTDWKGIMGTPH